MKAIILQENDATELLTKLELVKLRMLKQASGKHLEVQEMHRAFHFEVTKWMQSHGFDATKID